MTLSSSQFLRQALANVEAKLLDLTANPKPNYSIEGQSISWDTFRKNLWAERLTILQQINLANGPGEVTIEGLT